MNLVKLTDEEILRTIPRLSNGAQRKIRIEMGEILNSRGECEAYNINYVSPGEEGTNRAKIEAYKRYSRDAI